MKKILVVDDNEDILYVVEEILISHNFKVHTHDTAMDLPGVVKRNQPDLILLDTYLLGSSVSQICKELKEKHHVPIILFSTNTLSEKKLEIYHADDFIEKPFEMQHLVEVLRLHLN